MKKKILKEIIKEFKPSEKEFKEIKNSAGPILETIKNEISASKIEATAFFGGSYAKKTLVKKENYDIDLYIRYNKKYGEISKITKELIRGVKKFEIIHGSRDYYRVKLSKSLSLEIIPTKSVEKAQRAQNVTDLSYFHVKYINKKMKTESLKDQVILAKAFCMANNSYGAESHIKGFSGYSLELLIIKYKTFEKFLKTIINLKKGKLIIDFEKKFKDNKEILMNLNQSKIKSPIILVDPTYKYRNVTAALSQETLQRVREAGKRFLKNPSKKFFEIQKINLNKIKQDAKKRNLDFLIVFAKTNKQPGSVAGSKLLKFYNHFSNELKELFNIKDSGFIYNKKQGSIFYFLVKKKEKIVFRGPKTDDKKNLERFRKKHKRIFIKNGRAFYEKKVKISLSKFLKDWINKNKKKLKDMDMDSVKKM